MGELLDIWSLLGGLPAIMASECLPLLCMWKRIIDAEKVCWACIVCISCFDGKMSAKMMCDVLASYLSLIGYSSSTLKSLCPSL